MMKFLGGSNVKLEGLLNTVMEDYAQVTRVMNFAQGMMIISSHEKLTTIEETAARFTQRKISTPALPHQHCHCEAWLIQFSTDGF